MSSKVARISFMLFMTIYSAYLTCCSRSKYSPVEKSRSVCQENASQDIFNILNSYPALEACFTESDLCRNMFEKKLFCELLANRKDADMLVEILDGLPPLFDPRIVSEGIFSEEIETEMQNKGPLPDLFSTLSSVPRTILSLPKEERQALYAYFDLPSSEASPSIGTYSRRIFKDICAHLATNDPENLNRFMDLLTDEITNNQQPRAQCLDHTDYEEELFIITRQAPEGFADMLYALRELLKHQEIKDNITDIITSIGVMLQRPERYPIGKSMLSLLADSHTKNSLGEILEGIWTKGPDPGERIADADIEGYGKNGKYNGCFREMLALPELMNTFIENMTMLHEEGYDFENVDRQFREYCRRDPFLQPLDGSGDFEDGTYYAPSENKSFQNYFGLQAFLDFSCRWNQPLTMTARFMYEESPAGEQVLELMREIIPTVDEITLAALIWSEIYEKDSVHRLGHGKPVTEKRGYGMMRDGVYVAPFAPDVIAGGSMALTQIADALINGPYDNIYDNFRWGLYERKVYMVLDLVQLTKRIPMLDASFSAYFKLWGIETFPLVLLSMNGINDLMFLDLESLLDAVLKEMNASSLPDPLKNLAINMIGQMVGSSGSGTSKRFLLPQDMRDLWPMLVSVTYYDPKAFHADRFLDIENPAAYSKFYDVHAYNYAQNADTANTAFPFIAAVMIGSYQKSLEVVQCYPTSLEYLEIRRSALLEAFGSTETPIQFSQNMVAPFTEHPVQESAYARPDSHTTFLETLIMWLDADSSGYMDAMMHFAITLGKPEYKELRMQLLKGLAAVVKTTTADTSDGAYACASELLDTPQKAKTDADYWDLLRWKYDTIEALLSDDYQLRENLVGLISSTNDSSLQDIQRRNLAKSFTSIMGGLCEDHFLTRCLIDLGDTIKHANNQHAWNDAAGLMRDSLADDGVADYLIVGMHKADGSSWDELFMDLDEFLHSELVMSMKEGSFWDSVKKLITFMVEAIE